MNALRKLANGMSGRDAIAKAWATCPSKVNVKHPDGASVKTGVKAGASAKDIADAIVIAAATIKRGDGLSLSKKLASAKPDVTGSQSCELDKLDSQSHAGIVSDFADSFGASEEACEEAAGKILARTAAFERALQDAERLKIAHEAKIAHERATALKVRLNSAIAQPDEKEAILGWINEGEYDQAQAALDECVSV